MSIISTIGELTHVAGVDTWNLDCGTRSTASAVGDLNLTAGNVELGTAEGLSYVQSNGFHADEVSVLTDIAQKLGH